MNPNEAKSWLTNNQNPSTLAGNRFQTTQEALNFVEKLYNAGALEVTIDNIFNEEKRIQEEGGPYADSLIVRLPQEPEKRTSIFKIYNEELSNELGESAEDRGQDSITFWWD